MWPGPSGAIIHDVRIGARHDLVVMDVEAVRERQRRALLDVRLDLLVDVGDLLVGQQDHDPSAPLAASSTSATFRPAFLTFSHGAAGAGRRRP